MDTRRPRLAYPFTVLAQPDTVRLVAGEDHRYTLTGPGLDRWLPALFARFTGAWPLGKLLDDLPDEQRRQARLLVERLYGERVLVDSGAAEAHVARAWGCTVTGQGALCERLRSALPAADGNGLVVVLCQDSLDYAFALAEQRRARQAGEPFLWASCAALSRGYVGPLFLPDTGPCFSCLLSAFRRLSPAPELYDALLEHGEQGKPFEPAPFPDEGVAVLEALVRWKLAQAALEQPPAGLYRLHVLELGTMEVSSERVFIDPECTVCRGGRR
jgi:bacteriocin biosynthesis cyclodehydratase domain-containing protein